LNQGKKFEEDFQSMMLAQAGKTTNRKRKVVTIVEVAAVHKLDSDTDDNEDSGRCSTGNASTIRELNSQGTNTRSTTSVLV
jgi:hypothetical protein